MATLRERLACFPSVAANGAALSARTHDAVADDADGAHVQGIVERVNAYGFEADPMVHGWIITLIPSVRRLYDFWYVPKVAGYKREVG